VLIACLSIQCLQFECKRKSTIECFLRFQGFVPVSSEIMSPGMGKHYDRPISKKEGDILQQIFVCIQIRSLHTYMQFALHVLIIHIQF
jgi:hypothetical protein